jgi:hypothetical protein
MSPFELVFALFGLLLGLAIAEVLGGFARAVKLRRSTRPVRVGWLTPLLGLFVVLDLTSFWVVAYGARDQLPANYLTLIAVSAIVGIYYLAASLIFPDDPGEWPDFDDHYDRQNRAVILGLLAANLGSAIGQIVLEVIVPAADSEAITNADLVDGVTGLAVLALLVLLIFVRGRRINAAILALLVALLLASAVLEALV